MDGFVIIMGIGGSLFAPKLYTHHGSKMSARDVIVRSGSYNLNHPKCPGSRLSIHYLPLLPQDPLTLADISEVGLATKNDVGKGAIYPTAITAGDSTSILFTFN